MKNKAGEFYFMYHPQFKVCIFLIFLAAIIPFQTSAQKGKAFTLEINGLIQDDDNKRSLEGVVVKLTLANGQTVQTATTTGNGKFKFILDPNTDYLITASKIGYTGKIISISTKDVDVNSATLDYYKFPISIGIFKEVEGLDVSVLKKPIGNIFYNQTSREFDYTADKFLREDMEKMLKEMEKKKKEEEERKRREAEEARKKAKEDAKAKAEAEAAARKKAEEDARNQKKNDLKAKADAEAEQKRRLEAEEQAKKDALADAKKRAEEDAKAKSQREADEKAALKKAAEEEAKASAAAQAEAELKKREEAKAKAEKEAQDRAEAKEAELARKRAEAEARKQASEEAKKIYVKNIEYETEDGQNYFIYKTIITNTKDEKTVYKRISYNWGGVYFKRDNDDITQDSFIQDLKNVVLKTD